MKLLGTIFVLLFSLNSFAQEKEWTMLVFMNAHGQKGSQTDLSAYAKTNLKWMQKVGSTANMNIVVEVGTSDSPGVQRVLINKGQMQVIDTKANADMGSADELKDFIQWTVQNYPAKHYFMDVWNHGMGWHAFAKQEDPDGKWHPGNGLHLMGVENKPDISFDANTHTYITTEQMGDVMRYFAGLIGHKVDIYGSDACLMAMAEVAGEMNGSVNYFVGSQEEEPMDGWPYDKFLGKWAANPDASAAEISGYLVDAYTDYYSFGGGDTEGLGSTFSAYDMNHFEHFMSAVASLKNDLVSIAKRNKSSILNVIAGTNRFNDDPDYKDFYHFYTRLKKANLGVSKATMDNVEAAYGGLVIANKASGAHEGRAYGISVWMPSMDDMDGNPMMGAIDYYSENIERYQGLEFDKQTQWSDFLSVLHNNRF